jgi:hypothetical protein
VIAAPSSGIAETLTRHQTPSHSEDTNALKVIDLKAALVLARMFLISQARCSGPLLPSVQLQWNPVDRAVGFVMPSQEQYRRGARLPRW